MSKFNLKSASLQMTFFAISLLAVFMLYTCMRQSSNEQTPTIATKKSTPTTSAAPHISDTLKTLTPHSNAQTLTASELKPVLKPANEQSGHLPIEHIATLNQTLSNNLSLDGVHATKREDGTVIVSSQGRLQTISVARIDQYGNLVFEEHNQSISSDINKETP